MSKKTGVITFIERERTNGKSDIEIQHLLLDAGWQMDIIRHAMDENPKKSLPIQTAPKKKWADRLLNPFVIGSIFIFLVLLVLII